MQEALDNNIKLDRLRKACVRARLDLYELIEKARRGEVQFHEVPQAVGVTALMTSGPYSVCYILVVGGTLDGVRELAVIIEDFARKADCKYLQTTGRIGFSRVFEELADGYKPKATLYEKVLR